MRSKNTPALRGLHKMSKKNIFGKGGPTQHAEHQNAASTDTWSIAVGYIVGRKRLEEALGFLAAVSRILVCEKEQDLAVDAAVRLAVPFLADWCAVFRTDETANGSAWSIASITEVAKDMSAKIHALVQGHELHRRDSVPILWSPGLEKGGLLSQPEFGAQDSFLEIGVASAIMVPLTYGGDKLGVLFCVTTRCGEGRVYGLADSALAEEFGRRLSGAIQIGRLARMIQRRKNQAT